MPGKSLMQRLRDNEYVLAANGYLMESERRGYLQAGAFVPEIVLEHPEVVEQMHREFVHAGSDVVIALMCNSNKEKLRLINRENDWERIVRTALRIAKKVAQETNTLMAGALSPSTVFDPNDSKTDEQTSNIFRDCVKWSVEEGADFMIAESFTDYGEAKLALEAIKKHGNGITAVVTLAPMPAMKTRDGLSYPDACRKLEECGADVVGLNSNFGPNTMIDLIKEVRKACKGPVGVWPTTYRCTREQPAIQNLTLPENGQRAYPNNLDYFSCSLEQIQQFVQQCKDNNIKYIGLSSGNNARYFRRVAETVDRKPMASRYTADMSKHYILGDQKHPSLHQCNLSTLRNMFGCH